MNKQLLSVALGFVVVLGNGVFGSSAKAVTLSTIMTIESSSLSFQVNPPIGGTETEGSSISGTFDIDLEADFSTGEMMISSVDVTGGSLQLDNDLFFDFELCVLICGTVATAEGTGIAGFPNTISPPSILSVPAMHDTEGQFNAGDHEIVLNQGQLFIDVFGGSSELILLNETPFSGASQSATPGEISLTRGVVGATTTLYDMSFFLPVEFTVTSLTSAGDVTTTITGSVNASVDDVLIDFVETNGLVGDVNQDGMVNGDGTGASASDDVSAFIDGWLSTDLTPGLSGYLQGDLNFDGVTNLADAYILHNALPPGAGSFDIAAFLSSVPEPSSLLLCMFGGVLMLGRRRSR